MSSHHRTRSKNRLKLWVCLIFSHDFDTTVILCTSGVKLQSWLCYAWKKFHKRYTMRSIVSFCPKYFILLQKYSFSGQFTFEKTRCAVLNSPLSLTVKTQLRNGLSKTTQPILLRKLPGFKFCASSEGDKAAEGSPGGDFFTRRALFEGKLGITHLNATSWSSESPQRSEMLCF